MFPLKCFNCDGIGHLLLNVLMVRITVALKKNILRRKRTIKMETREGTKINYSRKVYTQRKRFLHQTRMMIVTTIYKEYSSWK
jgi:hypothetical protein